MGASISTLGVAVKLLIQTHRDVKQILRRASQAPGLPVSDPTESYWLEDPPYPELVDAQSSTLPQDADIVIIGSGITGAAVAWSILHNSQHADRSSTVDADLHTQETNNGAGEEGAAPQQGDQGEPKRPPPPPPPRIVVLEARGLCSGATGRNGGHIKPSPHLTFAELRPRFGPSRAAELTRFMMKHVEMIPDLCAQQGWDIAECRQVHTCDLYFDEKARDEDFANVHELKKWMPEIAIGCLGENEAQEKFQTNRYVKGAITYPAGVLWSFRFISSVWKSLMDEFPHSITLETHTPAKSISPASSPEDEYAYEIETSRGSIKCNHVVHATNAFASEHIPAFRGKLTGMLAHMTAQRPGKRFPAQYDGSQSWSVMYGNAYDYIAQRPPGVDGTPGDLMIGGAFNRSANDGLACVGVWDDSKVDPLPMAHLGAIFPTIFEPNWGADADEGRVKKTWTGIVAATGDYMPFVGRLDPVLTHRMDRSRVLPPPTRPPSSLDEQQQREQEQEQEQEQPGDSDSNLRRRRRSSSSTNTTTVASAGEWVSAGYCGDGMALAWLCGTAVGAMITGTELLDLPAAPGRPAGRVVDWFPHELLVSPKRVRKAGLQGLADKFL